MFYSDLPHKVEYVQKLSKDKIFFVITHSDFRGTVFDGRLIDTVAARKALAEGKIELDGEEFEVREPKVRRFNVEHIDHSLDFEIMRGRKQAVLVTPGQYVLHSATFGGGHVQSVTPEFAATSFASGLYDRQ